MREHVLNLNFLKPKKAASWSMVIKLRPTESLTESVTESPIESPIESPTESPHRIANRITVSLRIA